MISQIDFSSDLAFKTLCLFEHAFGQDFVKRLYICGSIRKNELIIVDCVTKQTILHYMLPAENLEIHSCTFHESTFEMLTIHAK